MFNKPILSQKRSLFDIYTANQFQAIIVPARTLYNKWKEQEPSVYEIVTVSDHKEFIVVKDLRDEQTYKVFYLATDNYIEGSLIIGSLIPYANYYGFLYSTIKLFEHDYLEVKQLLIQFDESKTDNFPELLAEILQQGGMEINQNKQSSHDEVAQLFADSLTEKNIEDAIILKGIKAWKKYCAQVNPIIKNTRTYACALEYYVQKVLLDNDGITQDQLAKEYDVSKNTVSTNYRKIYNELK
ncbi:hypothetical protein JCM21714_4375 [Gracilibacillus boraciitolerans JCM 21714]|uniref:Uncharacterized protein n=1 Tax=Gracilibacillus boraciitolerans JCM 21714 TaxID=1298598 RepID=W4VPN0_9BACI|nr:helix-turn-helix domain-containing protein [Gracilibacillus boraciitolerans]GAE95162.1 hypothetical protein JCM21714_4375 [Gracilibacillus boraciitolerans JCM 21714]